MNTIQVQGLEYELVQDVREGWDSQAFEERYSEVLNKYDYIVGDWGYEKLRLRGFYDDYNRKAKSSIDARISTLDEYIYEYCNFGCAFFVLKKVSLKEGDQKHVEMNDIDNKDHEIEQDENDQQFN